MNNNESRTHFFDYLWDLWCIVSVIGIWPRFIEPNLLQTTHLPLKIKNLPDDLNGMRILQFSDLHFHPRVPKFYLNSILKKVKKLSPDLILFTGDFLCNTKLYQKERLKEFLNNFQAAYGCYAILGNHDYSETISINDQGDYDVVNDPSSLIGKGMKRLFAKITLTSQATEKAKNVKPQQELIQLLKETPFKLLDNQTTVIPIKKSRLNVTGVGEKMLGRCLPEKAFEGYDLNSPGITMAHNPDCVSELASTPGELVLCGHTHGAQVNLPFFAKKFMILEDMKFKRGLFREDEKWIYVNRGLGSTMPFRWFSLPEITLATLEDSDE